MKSKAHMKGHPMHPMLIVFPIAFFVGTFVFDLVGFLNADPELHQVAKFLTIGALGTALLAAIPGLIDLIFTVPPKSTAKKRGVKHALTNTTVVILFSVALWLRLEAKTSLPTLLVLEGIGVILLTVAGWMGGTLVYRNQIGVDPRYAHAGKWKEKYFGDSSGTVEVASPDELKVNQMMLLHFGNRRIVLGKTETGYKAFDDHCTHRGGSLAGGSMICGTVQCPWHGSQFEVNSGAVKAGPAKEDIRTYPVQETGNKVLLSL